MVKFNFKSKLITSHPFKKGESFIVFLECLNVPFWLLSSVDTTIATWWQNGALCNCWHPQSRFTSKRHVPLQATDNTTSNKNSPLKTPDTFGNSQRPVSLNWCISTFAFKIYNPVEI